MQTQTPALPHTHKAVLVVELYMDLSKYESMKKAGKTPTDVFEDMLRNSNVSMETIERQLIRLFGISREAAQQVEIDGSKIMRKKYFEMKENGATPEEVYAAAFADTNRSIWSMGTLVPVFGISIIEAREIMSEHYLRYLREQQ